MAGKNANDKKIDLTTTIGTLSFPHVFESTKTKNDKGEDIYDIQIIIPKTDRVGLQALARAIKEVGQSRWGDNYNKVKNPLRDGDKEKDKIADDGQTYGDKYPERLGCYFLNARSRKPVGVFDRERTPITDPNVLYGGCKGRISVTFYPYSTQGNSGVGVGLNGVQMLGEGEPLGGGRPNVESMFDLLPDEDDLGLDDVADEPEPEPEPETKPAAKKAAKGKGKGKKQSEPAPVDEDDDADAGYDDLDDLDSLADDDS